MRLRQYLSEGEITRKDRKTLSQVVVNPEKGKFKLQDGTVIEVDTTRNGPELIFDKDNEDLILALTEICDSLGYDFDYNEKDKKIIFKIKK